MQDFHNNPEQPEDVPQCAAAHTHDAPAAPVWCRPCAERIRDVLDGLYEAYVNLANTTAVITRPKSERATHAGPGTVPSEIAHADEILRTVCAWDDELRRHLDLTRRWWAVDHRGYGRDLAVAIEYLTEHHTAALSAPFADDYGREILALVHTADTLRGTGDTPLRPARIRLEALCTECGRQALHKRNGAEGIECAHCGTVTAEEEYAAYAGVIVQAFGVPELARANTDVPFVDEAELTRRQAWGTPQTAGAA